MLAAGRETGAGQERSVCDRWGVERFGAGYVDKYVCVFFHSTGLEAQIELGRKLT